MKSRLPQLESYTIGRRLPLCRIVQTGLPLSLLLVICLTLGTPGHLAETTNTEAGLIKLTAGKSIAREFSGGDKQGFEISLTHPDQLIRFSISKGDLALSVVLTGPAGQKLLEQVSHSYELLELSVVASEAGAYRLEIRSLESGEARRRYELRLEPVNAVTAQDEKDNSAGRAIARASILRADWKEKSLRQAIESYDAAALIWRSSRNLRSAAVASMKAGEVFLVLGDYREALKRYQKAVDEASSARARLQEAEAQSQIGRLHSYLGNNDQAQGSLLKALEFLAADKEGNQPATSKQAYAQALSNLGEVNYSKGNLVKSSSDFEHALKVFQ